MSSSALTVDDVPALVAKIRADPRDNASMAALVPLAAEYLARGSGKRIHLFCDREGDAEMDLQTCMLRVFSFQANEQTERWAAGIMSSITTCTKCLRGYMRAREELPDNFLWTFSEAKVKAFNSHIDEWEVSAARKLLKQHRVAFGTGLRRVPEPALFAVITFCPSPASAPLLEDLRAAITSDVTKLLVDVPVAIIALFMDPSLDLRTWARAQVVGSSSDDAEARRSNVRDHIKSIKDKLMSTKTSALMRKDAWSVVPYILRLFPAASSELSGAIVAHLQDQDNFDNILEALSTILKIKGAELFRDARNDELPYVLMTSVLDNPAFMQALSSHGLLANEEGRERLFGWVDTLLGALHAKRVAALATPPPTPGFTLIVRSKSEDRRQNGQSTDNVADTEQKANGQFELVLKLIANFYFERTQHGQVPNACRIILLQEVLRLLSSLFDGLNCTWWDCKERAKAAHFSALTTVLSLYSTQITNVAIGGRTPSNLQKVGPYEDVRQSALDLLGKVLQQDAQYLRDGIFKLATYATGCLDAWQKRRRRTKGPDGKLVVSEGLTPEELYVQARKRLPPSPVLSEQLWTASYRALASNATLAGITIMIEAVSIIAPFHQLSADKHALPTAPGSTDSKGYSQYKNDLDVHVEELSKSLLIIREGFAEKVTDRAEFMSEDDLQSICCLSTGGMVALGLSPDAQLHKTSQVLVRQAFVSAETRMDCFRQLFRSNPQSALRGVEKFLSIFIKTMQTLVEANEIAKWVIRSAADMVEVLCGMPDGLLRTGVPFSMVGSSPEAVQRHVPTMWKLMCESICVIFEKTPKWSRLLPEAEITTWMRDVTIFGRQLAEALPIILRALSRSSKVEGASSKQSLLADLAVPLEAATSWLRLNKPEILIEVLEFINVSLEAFPRGSLPDKTKATFLDFIASQLSIESLSERRTLMSTDELMSLRHRLEPEAPIVIIDDDDDSSEDDDADEVEMHLKRNATPVTSSSAPSRSRIAVVIESPKRQRSVVASSRNSAWQGTAPNPVVKRKSSPPRQSRNMYQGATAVAAGSKLAKYRSLSHSTRHRDDSFNDRPIAPAPSRASQNVVAPAAHPSRVKEESESSDSDDPVASEQAARGLAGLAQIKRPLIKPKVFKSTLPTVPVRRTQILVDPAMQKAMHERAEAERKRKLREPPDYTSLHRSILCWDYYAQGELPDLTGLGSAPAREVPPVFASAEAYGNVFGPMLLMECWAQLQQAKEDIGNRQAPPLTGEIMGRANVDCWTDVSVVLPPQAVTSANRLSDSEIILVQEPNEPTVGQQYRRAALAKVESCQIRSDGTTITLRLCLEPDRYGVGNVMGVGLKCCIHRLFPLATVHREFAALTSLQHFPLVNDILGARVAESDRISQTEVDNLSRSYRLNRSQSTAILGSLAHDGFSLVQGPPGTGKTSMIVGLVAAFMTKRRTAAKVHAGEAARAGVSKKVLVCAPSNAAIDELALRLATGLQVEGMIIKPNVIRIGIADKMNVGVRHISLEVLLQERLGNTNSGPAVDTSSLVTDLRRLRVEREGKMAALNDARANGQSAPDIETLAQELRVINSKRQDTMSKLDDARDKQQAASRQQDADTRRIRLELFNDADVICCTLGGAGHEMMTKLPFEFETVIIDEAAQAVELSALIPLRYGARQCIMVGDPNQLPPTVISSAAARLKYSQSLFVRMFQRSESNAFLLNIQYRMHPSISTFPSSTFYDSKLLDGPDMAELTAQPWHEQDLFQPFKFFDTKGTETKGRGHSLVNREEAEVILALVARLTSSFSAVDFERRIGVITMYKDQVFELKRVFRARFGQEVEEWIDFNTVDGFQGQEKMIVILSCVRAGSGGVGFLSDRRRVNVAMTRAKSNLFVVGNAEHLRKDTLWSKVVSHAEARGVLQTVTTQTFSKPLVPASVRSAALPSKSTLKRPSTGGSSQEKQKRKKEAPPEANAAAAAAAMTPQQLKKQGAKATSPTSTSTKKVGRAPAPAKPAAEESRTSKALSTIEKRRSSDGLTSSKIGGSPADSNPIVKRPRQDNPIRTVAMPATSAVSAIPASVPSTGNNYPTVNPSQIAAAPHLLPVTSLPAVRPQPPPASLPGIRAQSTTTPTFPSGSSSDPTASQRPPTSAIRPLPPQAGPSKQALSALFVKKKPPRKK